MFGFWKRQPSVTLTAGPATTPTRSSPVSHRRFAPPPYGKKFGSDYVGLAGFHDRAFVIARPAEPYAAWLQQRAMTLHDRLGGTGTNISAGLRTGIQMLGYAPAGALKRIYLLSDGAANRETDQIMPAVSEAHQAHINVNTIGLGDSFDEALLRQIAAGTHNGRFVSVQGLRELTDALIARGNGGVQNARAHRSETTVVVCDCSLSMSDAMGGTSKIGVVEEAVMRLLLYKQKLFA